MKRISKFLSLIILFFRCLFVDFVHTIDNRIAKMQSQGLDILSALPTELQVRVLQYYNSQTLIDSVPYGPWEVDTIIESAMPGIMSVAFHPKSNRLAIGAARNSIQLVDPTTQTTSFYTDNSKMGDEIRAIAFNKDGTQLAAASNNGIAQVFNLPLGEKLFDLSGHNSWLSSAVFSPDGSQLATSSFDNSVRLWSLNDGSQIAKFEDNFNLPKSLVFNNVGNVLAYAAGDTVKLRSTKTNEVLRELKIADDTIESIAFHPNRPLIAAGTKKGRVHVWNILGRLLKEIPVSNRGFNSILSITFDVRGENLVAGLLGGGVCTWNLDTDNSNIIKPLDSLSSICVSKDDVLAVAPSFLNARGIALLKRNKNELIKYFSQSNKHEEQFLMLFLFNLKSSLTEALLRYQPNKSKIIDELKSRCPNLPQNLKSSLFKVFAVSKDLS